MSHFYGPRASYLHFRLMSMFRIKKMQRTFVHKMGTMEHIMFITQITVE